MDIRSVGSNASTADFSIPSPEELVGRSHAAGYIHEENQVSTGESSRNALLALDPDSQNLSALCERALRESEMQFKRVLVGLFRRKIVVVKGIDELLQSDPLGLQKLARCRILPEQVRLAESESVCKGRGLLCLGEDEMDSRNHFLLDDFSISSSSGAVGSPSSSTSPSPATSPPSSDPPSP